MILEAEGAKQSATLKAEGEKEAAIKKAGGEAEAITKVAEAKNTKKLSWLKGIRKQS